MLTAQERLRLIRVVIRYHRSNPSAVETALETLERDLEEQEKEEWVRKKYPWLFAPAGFADNVTDALNALNEVTDQLREMQRQAAR